jgi:hypothetical protein
VPAAKQSSQVCMLRYSVACSTWVHTVSQENTSIGSTSCVEMQVGLLLIAAELGVTTLWNPTTSNI